MDDRGADAAGLDRPRRRVRLMLAGAVLGIIAGFAAAVGAIASDDAVGMVIALFMLSSALFLFVVCPKLPPLER